MHTDLPGGSFAGLLVWLCDKLEKAHAITPLQNARRKVPDISVPKPTNTAIKAVLFDLDDTLFDHTYSVRQAVYALRVHYSVFQQSSFADLSARMLELIDLVHPRVLRGELTPDEGREERFRLLLWEHGLSPEQSALEAKNAAEFYRKTYQENRREVSGASQLLGALHGRVKIGVVTNNVTSEQEAKLSYLSLDRFVDVLVTSEATGHIKPDPAIFHAALAQLGCQAHEAVMVGDAWKADVLGARSAGIQAIWLNREGKVCPEPGLAKEIQGFEPLPETMAILLGNTVEE